MGESAKELIYWVMRCRCNGDAGLDVNRMSGSL